MSRVAVVGGGISGLVAAFDLMRGGQEVHLLEAAPRLGGCIGRSVLGDYEFENGPVALQGRCPAFHQLAQDLGLADDVLEAEAEARDRYLYYHGRLRRLPQDLKEFLRSPLFTFGQKARAFLEPLVPVAQTRREETVAEFFGRRVGRGITMTWVDVVVAGSYAGNPNRLGIQSAFPDLGRVETEHGSLLRTLRTWQRQGQNGDGRLGAPRLFTIRGGLMRLIERLEQALGGRAHRNCRVRTLGPGPEGGFLVKTTGATGEAESLEVDRIVLAVAAPTAGILLAPLASDVADLLFEVEYSPLVITHAAFAAEALPGLPRGYGFLVPRCVRMRTLGWIFYSQLFPGLAPEGKVLLHGFLGGALDPHALEADDALIRNLMLGELTLALGQRKLPQPEAFGVLRWPEAVPQYNVGHLRRVGAVKKLLEVHAPNLFLAGNWLSGHSLEKCIDRSREVAMGICSARPEGAPPTGGDRP